MKCGHKHLEFIDNGFYIKCMDCDQHWMAVVAKGVSIPTINYGYVPDSETRHCPFVLPKKSIDTKGK